MGPSRISYGLVHPNDPLRERSRLLQGRIAGIALGHIRGLLQKTVVTAVQRWLQHHERSFVRQAYN